MIHTVLRTWDFTQNLKLHKIVELHPKLFKFWTLKLERWYPATKVVSLLSASAHVFKEKFIPWSHFQIECFVLNAPMENILSYLLIKMTLLCNAKFVLIQLKNVIKIKFYCYLGSGVNLKIPI